MLPAHNCIYISATGLGTKVADGHKVSPPVIFTSFVLLRGTQDTLLS